MTDNGAAWVRRVLRLMIGLALSASFGLLLASNLDSLQKTRFGFFILRLGTFDLGLKRELPLEPIQLGLVETFIRSVHYLQCLSHHLQGFVYVPPFPFYFSQQAQVLCYVKYRARRPVRIQPEL